MWFDLDIEIETCKAESKHKECLFLDENFIFKHKSVSKYE